MTDQALPYINQSILSGWSGPNELREGKRIFDAGWVEQLDIEAPLIRGRIQLGTREILTRFKFLPDGSIENQCPCRDSRERGLVCSHAIALGLAYIDLTGDPHQDRALRIEARRQLEARRGRDSRYWKLAGPESLEGSEARLRLKLDPSWPVFAEAQGVYPLLIQVRVGGKNIRADKVHPHQALRFSPMEHELVYILEDMAGGALPACLSLHTELMVQLLATLKGQSLHSGGDGAEVIEILDRPILPHLSLHAVPSSQDALLSIHVDLPSANGAGGPAWVIGRKSGWVYHDHAFYPLEAILPKPYRDLYTGPRTIARIDLSRFLARELPGLEELFLVDQGYPVDQMRYSKGSPVICMMLAGNHEQLTMQLMAEYGPAAVPCGAGGIGPEEFAAPDPEDGFHYWVRDPDAEADAMARLPAFGLEALAGDRLPPLEGTRAVVDFLASRVPAMRAAGWRVDYGGWLDVLTKNAEWVVPHVDYTRSSDETSFTLQFNYYDGEEQLIPPHLVEDVYVRGESCLEWKGRTILIDRDLLHALHQTLSDIGLADAAAGKPYAVDAVNAGYALAAAENLRGVTMRADQLMKAMAERQNRLSQVDEPAVPERLREILRPYQKDGIGWLAFLERNGFGGILADEMGLGKTVQTLVWLEQMWQRLPGPHRPALVVCPTSLVVNWAEESRKFTPDLRVLMMTGSDRHKHWKDMGKADLVITSYALLRRDVQRYHERQFAAAILDEAQHIKNHSTQNARSAKQIRADHRLVLTGTPMENTVSDLWSIFDFLMPGYLGNHAHFRRNFEQPIGAGGLEAEACHARLHRKVHPFLLRRMKRDVAKELPDKIDRVAYCDMSPDQLRMYRRMLESSAQQLSELVESQGFARSRFTVLKTLTRLRQICCHLDLLNGTDFKVTQPSAKLDLLNELIDEAMDSGHRVLLFSQFVSMLSILRRDLEQRKIPYCYLDGSTVKRLEEVHRFNNDESIPLFLISLKAGGTGLNLTGADMVIHYDPWWNPAVEDQATDRAHRIGQKRTVYNIKLITRNSIEEKVLALQEKKRTMIDATLQVRKDLMGQLTWEDIKELLTI
ncbi:MAG: DEAD/DEAH box helicase [Verrucomicrobia bacterium]|nr:DEAD/DEAH box helicase [Verrucomicrobiota bacterium]